MTKAQAKRGKTMTPGMKVYHWQAAQADGRLYARWQGRGPERVQSGEALVAAPTQSRAFSIARQFGEVPPLREFSETKMEDHIRQAMKCPGVVFWRAYASPVPDGRVVDNDPAWIALEDKAMKPTAK